MEHYLPYLLILACPISMGAMMFVMMKGGQQTDASKPDPEIEDLKRQVEALRQTHAEDNSKEYANKAS